MNKDDYNKIFTIDDIISLDDLIDEIGDTKGWSIEPSMITDETIGFVTMPEWVADFSI